MHSYLNKLLPPAFSHHVLPSSLVVSSGWLRKMANGHANNKYNNKQTNQPTKDQPNNKLALNASLYPADWAFASWIWMPGRYRLISRFWVSQSGEQAGGKFALISIRYGRTGPFIQNVFSPRSYSHYRLHNISSLKLLTEFSWLGSSSPASSNLWHKKMTKGQAKNQHKQVPQLKKKK